MTTNILDKELSVGEIITVDDIDQPTITEQPLEQQVLLHSRAYSSKVNINPLVGAASPIFTLINRFKQHQDTVDIQDLRSNLAYEVQAFESKATHQGYAEKIVLAGRYVLCAFVDDIIGHSKLGRASQWQNHSLMSGWQREAYAGEQFFNLLERSCNEPELCLDLLELFYLSLRLGYEGQYRHLERGHAQLMLVTDSLYQTIRQQRGELSTSLLLAVKHQPATAKKTKLSLHFIFTIVFILALISGSVIFFSHELSNLMKPTISLINSSFSASDGAANGS